MPSKHEAILAALIDILDAHTMTVEREPDLDRTVGANGLLSVAPADPVEEGRHLGTGAREWVRDVELEHIVRAASPAARGAAVDAAMAETVALLTEQTLGGRVDYIDLGGPEEADDVPFDGAETQRGAVLIARLYYTTSTNPLETDP